MHLRRATLADLPFLADAGKQAFNEDQLFEILHPHRKQYPDDFRGVFRRLFHEAILSSDCLVMVVVTEPGDAPIDGTKLRYDGQSWSKNGGDIVGAAVWRRTGSDGEPVRVNNGGFLMALEYTLTCALWSPFTHPLLRPLNRFYPIRSASASAAAEFDEIRSADEARLFPKIFANYYLKILAVHPAWQRKGVGKMLARDGIARARRENVPIRLESSPNGAGLYRSFGFRDVGSMTELRGVTGPIFIWDPAVDGGEKGELTEKSGNGSM